jgi:hypothetical protein
MVTPYTPGWPVGWLKPTSACFFPVVTPPKGNLLDNLVPKNLSALFSKIPALFIHDFNIINSVY